MPWNGNRPEGERESRSDSLHASKDNRNSGFLLDRLGSPAQSRVARWSERPTDRIGSGRVVVCTEFDQRVESGREKVLQIPFHVFFALVIICLRRVGSGPVGSDFLCAGSVKIEPCTAEIC